MPSRWTALAIIAFWLSCMGWMFISDILPGLQRHVPPPYTIDPVDEAKVSTEKKNHIRWNVYLEGDAPRAQMLALREAGNIAFLAPSTYWLPGQASMVAALDSTEWARFSPFTARTYVEYNEEDDSFTFNADFDIGNSRSQGLPLGILRVKQMSSSYRVNRDGQLQAIEANFTFDAGKAGVYFTDIEARLSGEVVNKVFHSSYQFRRLPVLGELKDNLPPVKMTHNGSVLIPLQPVNRIKGLKPGQTWSMPLINPLEDALSASQVLGIRKEMTVLHARVLPELQQLPNTKTPVKCLVIEYDDEAVNPRTWVQASTGLVVRQEATLMHGARMVMQRRILLADR